jgi:hypothetical protein
MTRKQREEVKAEEEEEEEEEEGVRGGEASRIGPSESAGNGWKGKRM